MMWWGVSAVSFEAWFKKNTLARTNGGCLWRSWAGLGLVVCRDEER